MMSTKEEEAVRDYCSTGYTDCDALRANVSDFIRRAEGLPDAIKGHVRSAYPEFHSLLDEIEADLETLINHCPEDWLTIMEGIESRKDELIRKLRFWEFAHAVDVSMETEEPSGAHAATASG